MRTTIELPDDLFRRLKARAALDGTTLKEMVAWFVESGLRRSEPQPSGVRPKRSEIPVARPATGRPLPDLSHSDLWSLLEDGEITPPLDD